MKTLYWLSMIFTSTDLNCVLECSGYNTKMICFTWICTSFSASTELLVFVELLYLDRTWVLDKVLTLFKVVVKLQFYDVRIVLIVGDSTSTDLIGTSDSNLFHISLWSKMSFKYFVSGERYMHVKGWTSLWFSPSDIEVIYDFMLMKVSMLSWITLNSIMFSK